MKQSEESMTPLTISKLVKKKECPVSRSTIVNYCKYYGLPHTRINKIIYIDLNDWINWFRSFTKTQIMSKKIIETTMDNEIDK